MTYEREQPRTDLGRKRRRSTVTFTEPIVLPGCTSDNHIAPQNQESTTHCGSNGGDGDKGDDGNGSCDGDKGDDGDGNGSCDGDDGDGSNGDGGSADGGNKNQRTPRDTGYEHFKRKLGVKILPNGEPKTSNSTNKNTTVSDKNGHKDKSTASKNRQIPETVAGDMFKSLKDQKAGELEGMDSQPHPPGTRPRKPSMAERRASTQLWVEAQKGSSPKKEGNPNQKGEGGNGDKVAGKQGVNVEKGTKVVARKGVNGAAVGDSRSASSTDDGTFSKRKEKPEPLEAKVGMAPEAAHDASREAEVAVSSKGASKEEQELTTAESKLTFCIVFSCNRLPWQRA